MAEFLLGYAYEPEYTPEELEARSKAAAASVCTEAWTSVLTPIQRSMTEATSAGSDWCQCACCRPMPTSSECVCCHTSELTLRSLKGRRYITEDWKMQTVVLNVGPAAFAQKSFRKC